MKVLVTAATRHQATAEIADRIAATLAGAGVEAVQMPPDEVADLGGYDAVILGSAVYVGRWIRSAEQFIDRFGHDLSSRPVWLFSCGPIGEPAEPSPELLDVHTEMARTGAREHKVFSGRLDRSVLGFTDKLIAKVVHAPDGDYRDWEDVQNWAAGIASELSGRPVR